MASGGRSVGHAGRLHELHDRGHGGAGAPGKRTLTEQLPAASPPQLQRMPMSAERSEPDRSTRVTVDSMFGGHLAHRAASNEQPVQRKAGEGSTGKPDASRAAGGGALPADVRASMERSFDADFSAVRIHQGEQAGRIGALAYTQGTDIHFAPGQYSPGSTGGRELLGHELAHVVQQASGRVQATTQMKGAGLALNDDRGLEQEADRAGARAARGEPAGLSAGGRSAAASSGAPVQMNVGETLLAIATTLLSQTFTTGAAAAEAIALSAGISTTTVYWVAGMGLAISAAVALLMKYKRGEVAEDPDHAELSSHVSEVTSLLAGKTPYSNIVGQLITRHWYKARSLTWTKKLKLFQLIKSQVSSGNERGMLAQTVHALAEHEGQSGDTTLGTLGLSLPGKDKTDGKDESESVPKPSENRDDDVVDQAPSQVKSQLGQLRRAMASDKKLKMFGRLDRIEQRIFAWFERYKGDLAHPQRAAMFGYLDEVQELHEELTAHQIDNDLDLWLPDNLGPKEDRGRIQEIWHAIVAGNAQITFDQDIDKSFGRDIAIPPEVTREIKVEVISQLGRLMSQPQGRALIAIFFESEDTGVVNFKLAQLYRIVVDSYVGDSAAARNDGHRSLSSAPHVATGNRKKKGRKVERGRGQNSDVMVTPGKTDSLFLDYDKDYNRILSPGYIGLGHELVHAAHNLRGVAIGDWSLEGMPPEFDDLEEFVTIAPHSVLDGYRKHKVTGPAYQKEGGTTSTTTTFGELLDLIGDIPNESDLRDEHGLEQRHEHISGLSDHTTGTSVPRKGEVSDIVKRSLPGVLQGLTL